MCARCAPCHSSCETCTGSNSSQCVSCKADHFWHDGSCIKECPAHHYADLQQQECVECSPGCSECNKTTCISCLDDWQVNSKGRCVPHGSDKCDVGKLIYCVTIFCSKTTVSRSRTVNGLTCEVVECGESHEINFLKLCCINLQHFEKTVYCRVVVLL